MSLEVSSRDPRVVLCGSFRRDMEGLRCVRDELVRIGCEVLSPSDLEFTHEVAGFVLSEKENGRQPADVEQSHLDAIAKADLVWVHIGDGYIGRSASMEVGFAHGLGIPIFASTSPADTCLASFVRVVSDPADALAQVRDLRLNQVGRPLRVLQAYYDAVARDRGYTSETAQDVMLLLTEEVGELARAVRKSVGLIREPGYGNEDPGEELADIQLYLVHLANTLEVDLAAAVSKKELINYLRHAASGEDEASATVTSSEDDGGQTGSVEAHTVAV